MLRTECAVLTSDSSSLIREYDTVERSNNVKKKEANKQRISRNSKPYLFAHKMNKVLLNENENSNITTPITITRNEREVRGHDNNCCINLWNEKSRVRARARV